MQRQIADYYRKLGKSAFEWHNRDFWRFHRLAMAKAGHSMSTRRLLQAILSEFTSSPLKRCRQLARGALKKHSAVT
jgi:hypothetical protein